MRSPRRRRCLRIVQVDLYRPTSVENAVTVGPSEVVVLKRRPPLGLELLHAIYAYGTNTGSRAVSSGAHGHNEDEFRYARWAGRF